MKEFSSNTQIVYLTPIQSYLLCFKLLLPTFLSILHSLTKMYHGNHQNTTATAVFVKRIACLLNSISSLCLMRVVANTKIPQFYCSKNSYSCFWWKILVTKYIEPGTFKAPEKGFPKKNWVNS